MGRGTRIGGTGAGGGPGVSIPRRGSVGCAPKRATVGDGESEDGKMGREGWFR